MKQYAFRDAQFMSAREKALVLKDWVRFLKNGWVGKTSPAGSKSGEDEATGRTSGMRHEGFLSDGSK